MSKEPGVVTLNMDATTARVDPPALSAVIDSTGQDATRRASAATNERIRYAATATDLSAYGPEDLEHVAQELNARPRKTLNWDAPDERLRDLLTVI